MWILYALLAAVAGAAVATLSKAGLKNVYSSDGLAIQSVLILLLSWGVVTIQGNLTAFGSIERKAWDYLIASGIVTSLSYFLLFKALKQGDAAQVTPVDRPALVFVIAFAAVFPKARVDAANHRGRWTDDGGRDPHRAGEEVR